LAMCPISKPSCADALAGVLETRTEYFKN
jgi:hypothetical protein